MAPRHGLHALLSGSRVGSVARKLYVLGIAHKRDALSSPLLALRFLARDPEYTSFTYDLANLDELAAAAADAAAVEPDRISLLARELIADEELSREVTARIGERRDRRRVPRWGRRALAYALVRALHPRLVVETGTFDGLMTRALERALEREGRGRLVTIDPDPAAGWLSSGLAERVCARAADAVPRLFGSGEIDLYIHGSNRDERGDRDELEAAGPRLAPRAVVMSDNCHAHHALRDWAAGTGRSVRLLAESPRAHFYRGATLGFARST